MLPAPARRTATISLFILGVGLIGAACSGGSTDPSVRLTNADSVKAALVGSWSLVGACGGITGQCQTANTLNEPDRYVFRTDDSVEVYRGAQRVSTLNFAVVAGATDPSRGDTRPALLIGLGPAVDPLPLRIRFAGDTTLYLDQGCCDRYTLEFRRNR